MLKAQSASRFNNEFGRPNLAGYFRTYEELCREMRGYHNRSCWPRRRQHLRASAEKHQITPGALIIQLGGPAMLIGLGGGAASSMDTARMPKNSIRLVQRGNPEMQASRQEVIDRCWQLGDENPSSRSRHRRGGLSNALRSWSTLQRAEFQACAPY